MFVVVSLRLVNKLKSSFDWLGLLSFHYVLAQALTDQEFNKKTWTRHNLDQLGSFTALSPG